MTPKQVRAWRKRRRLSRKELAEILGVHWMTVTAWEVGKQVPPKYLRYALRGIEIEVLDNNEPVTTNPANLKLLP